MATFHTRTLLATDLATAYAAMVDPAVTAQKYESLGNTDVHVETTDGDPGHRIHARRKVVVELPGFVAKILSPNNVYDQVDTWRPGSSGHDGQFEITVNGAPVHLVGTMTLREVAGGVDYVVDGEVKVSVPLVGGMAGSFAADQAAKVSAEEGRFLKERLG
jgi:hypothetical protein